MIRAKMSFQCYLNILCHHHRPLVVVINAPAFCAAEIVRGSATLHCIVSIYWYTQSGATWKLTMLMEVPSYINIRSLGDIFQVIFLKPVGLTLLDRILLRYTGQHYIALPNSTSSQTDILLAVRIHNILLSYTAWASSNYLCKLAGKQ